MDLDETCRLAIPCHGLSIPFSRYQFMSLEFIIHEHDTRDLGGRVLGYMESRLTLTLDYYLLDSLVLFVVW